MKTTQLLMIVLIALGAIAGATLATITFLEGKQSESEESFFPNFEDNSGQKI